MPFMPETWPNGATHYGTSSSSGYVGALRKSSPITWEVWSFRHGRWIQMLGWDRLSNLYIRTLFNPIQEIPGRNTGHRVPPAQCGVTGQLEKGTTMPVMTGTKRVDRTSNVTLTRAQVKPGQVFVVKGRNGAWGNTKYACLDSNGRFYSLKITPEGEMNLAATDNGASAVKIVGKWKLSATIVKNGDRRQTTRGQVKDGELFAVKGGDKVYAHVGSLKDGRLFSMVLNSDNHGVTANTRSKVSIVGSYTVDVSITG